MPISTDDCKALLLADASLLALGAVDPKGWKRLSKKNGAVGVERVFSHSSGALALVVEQNGAISVTARASSLSELHATASSPSAFAPAAAPSPSPFWPIAPNPVEANKAADLLAKFMDYDDNSQDDYWTRCEELDPVALASLHRFAIIRVDEAPTAIITPARYWLKTREVYDQQTPIGHILPEGSDDLNGCGTWEVGGYDTASEPMSLALDLLSRGFVWDPQLQAHAEALSGCPMPEIAALAEGRALEASVPLAPPARVGKRI